MANHSRDQVQRMEIHGKGISGFTEADIDQRAEEIARINNRTIVSDADRTVARDEFLARNLPDPVYEDADSMQSMSRDPSDPMVDRGHQVPEYGGDDENAALERLALEGVEEAQHEQMLEARNDRDELSS